jgi:hypothetical protein
MAAIDITVPSNSERKYVGTRYDPGANSAIPIYETPGLSGDENEFVNALSQEFGGRLPTPNQFAQILQSRFGRGQDAQAELEKLKSKWQSAYEDADRLVSTAMQDPHRIVGGSQMMARGIDPVKYAQAEAASMKKQADMEYQHASGLLTKQVTQTATQIDRMMTKYVDTLSKIHGASAKQAEKNELTADKLSSVIKEVTPAAHQEAAQFMKMKYGATINPETGELETSNKGYTSESKGFQETEAIKADKAYRKESDGTYTFTRKLSPSEAYKIYQDKVQEAMVRLSSQRMFPYAKSQEQRNEYEQYMAGIMGIKSPATGTQAIPGAEVQPSGLGSGMSVDQRNAIVGDVKRERAAINENLQGFGGEDAYGRQASDWAYQKRQGNNPMTRITIDPKTKHLYYNYGPNWREPLHKNMIGKYVDPDVIQKWVDATTPKQKPAIGPEGPGASEYPGSLQVPQANINPFGAPRTTNFAGYEDQSIPGSLWDATPRGMREDFSNVGRAAIEAVPGMAAVTDTTDLYDRQY